MLNVTNSSCSVENLSQRYVILLQTFETIKNDSSITLINSISISTSLVGDDYTVSALLPGTRADNIYILRRRQDPVSGLK